MKKILILDDDADINDLLSQIITDAGYQAISALTKKSIKEITDLNPDLILLDQALSELCSNLCFKIKNHPATRRIPIILLSAFPNVAKVAAANFADGYISKPFDIWEVENMVCALVRGGNKPEPNQISDRKRYAVILNNQA